MMSALAERFYGLDETIKSIKEQHELELRALSDRLMAAEIELSLTKATLDTAVLDRQRAESIAIKLIAQFGTVEAVFAEAKRLALSLDQVKKLEEESKIDPSPFAKSGDSQAIRRLAEVTL